MAVRGDVQVIDPILTQWDAFWLVWCDLCITNW